MHTKTLQKVFVAPLLIIVGAVACRAPALNSRNLKEVLFQNNADLVTLRQEVHDYGKSLRTGDITSGPVVLFNKWAMALYRDCLLYGISNSDPADPVLPELYAAYNKDPKPRPDLIRKCKLGDAPVAASIELLTRVQGLSGDAALSDALSIVEAFKARFKHAKKRSDTYFMSRMKDLLENKQLPLEEKIDYTRRFVAVRDISLAEYPREYFEELLKSSSLSGAQTENINKLLKDINQLRNKQ